MSDADFSLDSLRQVISEQYKPTTVAIGEGRTVRLEQIARLSDEKQESLLGMQKSFNELQQDGKRLNAGTVDVTPEQIAEWKSTLDREPTLEELDDFKREASQVQVSHEDVKAFKAKTVSLLEDMLKLVAQNADDGAALVEACNHDELLLMEVFKNYSKKTKLGEASASSSSSDSTAGQSSTTSGSSSV